MRAFALLLLAGLCSSSVLADTYVRGHYRSDGTYVQPHYRSSPDGSFNNNWSTKGNVNPHTGEYGTRVTPPRSHGSYGGSYGSGFGNGSGTWDNNGGYGLDDR